MAIISPREQYHRALLQLLPHGQSIQSPGELTPLCPHLTYEQIESIFSQAQSNRYSFALPPCSIKGRVHVLCLYKNNGASIQTLLTPLSEESLQKPFSQEAVAFANTNWPKRLTDPKKWKTTGTVFFKDPKNLNTLGAPTTQGSVSWAASKDVSSLLKTAKSWNSALKIYTSDPIEAREITSTQELRLFFCSVCCNELFKDRCITCACTFNENLRVMGDAQGASLPKKIAELAKREGIIQG